MKSLCGYVFTFISTLTAVAVSRFIRGSEGSSLLTTAFMLVFFLLICSLILIYRINGKRGGSVFLLFLISFLLFLFSTLVRLSLLDHLLPFFGGVTFLFQKNVSSGSSSGELSGPPPLESSSSTESLATYRNIIAAENEAQIYQRIRALEAALYYNLPPQDNEGEYETIVREHFDQALNVNHYLLIFDRETFELRVLEQKGVLQDRLFELMLSQPNLQRIYEVCLHTTKRVILGRRHTTSCKIKWSRLVTRALLIRGLAWPRPSIPLLSN